MPSFAEITKIVIDKREPFAAGHEFGVTGAYEKLVGKAYGEVDPKTHHNKNLVNLKNAPLNNRSRVEYSIDILILKPIDMQRGNQTIFYDVVNRGNQALRVNFGAERSNNPTTLAHAGDGFMMRQGYTLVWSGWQGDVLPGGGRLTTSFPVAKESGWQRDQTHDYHRVCFSETKLFGAAQFRPRIAGREALSGRRRKHVESTTLPPRWNSHAPRARLRR